jgi:hypothetical protein
MYLDVKVANGKETIVNNQNNHYLVPFYDGQGSISMA